jgi:hypothetical protein
MLWPFDALLGLVAMELREKVSRARRRRRLRRTLRALQRKP